MTKEKDWEEDGSLIKAAKLVKIQSDFMEYLFYKYMLSRELPDAGTIDYIMKLKRLYPGAAAQMAAHAQVLRNMAEKEKENVQT